MVARAAEGVVKPELAAWCTGSAEVPAEVSGDGTRTVESLAESAERRRTGSAEVPAELSRSPAGRMESAG